MENAIKNCVCILWFGKFLNSIKKFEFLVNCSFFLLSLATEQMSQSKYEGGDID